MLRLHGSCLYLSQYKTPLTSSQTSVTSLIVTLILLISQWSWVHSDAIMSLFLVIDYTQGSSHHGIWWILHKKMSHPVIASMEFSAQDVKKKMCRKRHRETPTLSQVWWRDSSKNRNGSVKWKLDQTHLRSIRTFLEVHRIIMWNNQ